MFGKVKFYLPEKRYGFITGADGVDTFFGEDQLTSGFAVERDVPVEFEVRTDPTNWKSYAQNVRCLNDSEVSAADFGVLSRFEGKVLFYHYRKFGRIEYYDEFSNLRSIFFHLSDVEPADDGVQYEPYEGCVVEFDRGARHGKELAVKIIVKEWPEVEPTIEETFLNAEELPVDIPEPKLQPESKLLRDHYKSKTLRELIRKKVKV